MNIGNTIKSLRTQRGISQEQMAEQLHVRRQAISNWETNKNYPDLATIIEISDQFGISIDELLKGDIDYVTHNDQELRISINRKRMNSLLTVTTAVLLVTMVIVFAFVWRPWRHESMSIGLSPAVNMSLAHADEHVYLEDNDEKVTVAEALSGNYDIIKQVITDPEKAQYFVQMWNDPDGYWAEIVILDDHNIVYNGYKMRKTDGSIDLSALSQIMNNYPQSQVSVSSHQAAPFLLLMQTKR